jgi:hypothetical protein
MCLIKFVNDNASQTATGSDLQKRRIADTAVVGGSWGGRLSRMYASDPAWPRPPGRWERLFADLDAVLAEEERAELAAEVADRTRAEFGRIRLVDRFRGAVGAHVGLRLAAGAQADGIVREVGADWLLLAGGPPFGAAEAARADVLVPLHAVRAVAGLGRWSAEPGSEGRVAARLDLPYVLRRLTRDRAAVSVTLTSGDVLTGTCDRVGADFVELAEHSPGDVRRPVSVRGCRVIPIPALALLRRL